MNKRRSLAVGVCMSLLFVAVPVKFTYAIEGGESALGENIVTLIKISDNGILVGQQCSGAVIAPRLVVTAKHCFDQNNHLHTGLANLNWLVTFPGSKIEVPFAGAAKILQIITTQGDFVPNTDDLSIAVIDRELPIIKEIEIASKEDLERFQLTRPVAITYGYGTSADSPAMSSTPKKITNVFVQNRGNPSEVFTVEYLSNSSYMCGGDSGGPTFVVENNKFFYVGPTSSGSREGCARGLIGTFVLNGTALAYRAELLETAKQAVLDLQQLEELKKKEDTEKATKKQLPKKKKVITCVRGAIQKRVVGVNAKCPVGYKKK
jgi:secreted trypsin-like serine protease